MKRWRLGAAVFAVGMLLGLALAWGQRVVVVAQPVGSSVRVTFYDCGLPSPCESIENLSTGPVAVTLRNTLKKQTVTIPAGGRIDVETDGSDNLPGSPAP